MKSQRKFRNYLLNGMQLVFTLKYLVAAILACIGIGIIVYLSLWHVITDYVPYAVINDLKWEIRLRLILFGVPMVFVDSKDTNRASFDTAMLQYQRFTVLPKVRQIVDDINAHIISRYDEPRIRLTYENPVDDDRDRL